MIDSVLAEAPHGPRSSTRCWCPTLSMAERDFRPGDIDEREQAFILRVAGDVLERPRRGARGRPRLALLGDRGGGGQGGPAPAKLGKASPEAVAPPKILAFPANDMPPTLLVLKPARPVDASPPSVPFDDRRGSVESPLKVVERITNESPDARS